MLQRDMSRFSVECFLSHSVEKYRRATPQGVTNFEYRKRLCFRGYVTKFCRNFLSHSTETFRRGTRNPSVLFFRKFVVAKKFTVKKAGEYQNFPSNFFLSQSAENFRRGTLYSTINLSYRKILCFKGLC